MEAIMDMSRFIAPKKPVKTCPPVVIGPNYRHQLQALMGETLCVIRGAACIRGLDTLRNTTSRLLQDLYIALFCHAPPCIAPEYPCASTGSVCSVDVLEGVTPVTAAAALLIPSQTTLFLVDLTSRLFRIYTLIIQSECPTSETLPFISCFIAYVFGNYLTAVAAYFETVSGACDDLAGNVVSNPCNPCDIVYQPPGTPSPPPPVGGAAPPVAEAAPLVQAVKKPALKSVQATKPVSIQAPKKVQAVKSVQTQKKTPVVIAKSVAEIVPPTKPASAGSRFTSLFKSNKPMI